MKTDVIVAAAGKGSRLGGEVNKPYLNLHGKPVLCYSLDFFEEQPEVAQVIVTAAQPEVEFCRREIVARYGYRKVRVVAGGAERQDSVHRGLQALQESGCPAPLIAVHDGARPFLNRELFQCLCRKAAEIGAAIPGVPVKDTIKEVNAAGQVVCTPPRNGLRAIQTPQVFDFAGLQTAYRKAQADGFSATDDAMLYEKYSGTVVVVDTAWDNLKITTPADWEWAQFLAKNREE